MAFRGMQNGMIGCLFLSFCFVTLTFAASCTLQSTQYMSGSSGVIRSPGYPFMYPSNAVYCWRIYVPQYHVIKLIVPSTNMEYCVGCKCDSIQVFNGPTEYSNSLGKYCSQSMEVLSSGQYAFVKFTFDASRNGDAFTVTFIAVRRADVPRDHNGNDNNNNGSDENEADVPHENNGNDKNNNGNNKKEDDNVALKLEIGGSVGGVILGVLIVLGIFWKCRCRGSSD